MNKVILMGRLTRDPELKYSSSAEPVAVTRFTLAVNRQKRQGQEQEADFIPVVSFGKRAETIANYCKKGQMISIVGRIQNTQYEDQQSGQKKTYTDVVLEDFYFAESKRDGQAAGVPKAPPIQPGEVDGFLQLEEDDEDLPF